MKLFALFLSLLFASPALAVQYASPALTPAQQEVLDCLSVSGGRLKASCGLDLELGAIAAAGQKLQADYVVSSNGTEAFTAVYGINIADGQWLKLGAGSKIGLNGTTNYFEEKDGNKLAMMNSSAPSFYSYYLAPAGSSSGISIPAITAGTVSATTLQGNFGLLTIRPHPAYPSLVPTFSSGLTSEAPIKLKDTAAPTPTAGYSWIWGGDGSSPADGQTDVLGMGDLGEIILIAESATP